MVTILNAGEQAFVRGEVPLFAWLGLVGVNTGDPRWLGGPDEPLPYSNWPWPGALEWAQEMGFAHAAVGGNAWHGEWTPQPVDFADERASCVCEKGH
jgi:hypothetical protein